MEHREAEDWRVTLRVAALAPETGMVPMRCATALAVNAEIARLRALLHEVVAFQSAPTSPTIHDFGRWRRAADGLGA